MHSTLVYVCHVRNVYFEKERTKTVYDVAEPSFAMFLVHYAQSAVVQELLTTLTAALTKDGWPDNQTELPFCFT